MRGQPNFAHSGDVKTRAKTQKTCQKGVLKPLTGVIRADRVIDDEVSVAQEVMRPPSRGSRTELPSAETDAWFLQGKGIFTGAFCAVKSAIQSAWEPVSLGMAPLSPKRISGDASTVKKEERKYCD